MKKIKLNTIMSLLSQGVTAIVGFILPKLILDCFGSEVNGLVQSIRQFLGIITLLDLGIGQVIRSSLYRPLAQKDDAAVSHIVLAGRKFYRRIACALAAYALLLAVIYPNWIVKDFGGVYTASLIVVMAISSFAQYYLGIVNEQLLHADQRGYVIFTIQIAVNLLNALLCVILIRLGSSIHVVKLATSLVYLARPVLLSLYIRRHYRIDRTVAAEGDPIAQKWNGLAQHISAVVLDGTDTIVLTLFSTLSDISVYSVYYMVISCLQQLYQALTAGVQSAAGALWAKRDVAAQKRLFATAQTGLHFIVVFLFTCAGILIVPFARVYTDGLTDAVYEQPLFAALLVSAYAIRCLRTPYNIWILAAGHYRQTQRCHITAAAVNLLISVLTVSRFGLIGIAVGTLTAMIYQTVWMAVYNARNLLKWSIGDIAKQFSVDVLCAAVTCLLCSGFELTDVSYFGWFVMAVKVALVALGVIGVAVMVFYRKYVAEILKSKKKTGV